MKKEGEKERKKELEEGLTHIRDDAHEPLYVGV
jgi:hypothetical protein